MNYFIDTNIALGHTIVPDRIHQSTKKFIDENYKNTYWSTLVRKEYQKKLRTILQSIIKFLNKCILIIENYDGTFINLNKFEEHIIKKTRNYELDEYKKRKILYDFWYSYPSTYESSEKLCNNLKHYINRFKQTSINLDNKLNNELNYYNCGINNYKKYLIHVLKLEELGVHYPDSRIITDVYDFSLKIRPTTFISCDENLIDTLNNMEITFIEISGFKSIC